VRKSSASAYRNLANTCRLSRKTSAGIAAALEAEKLWRGLADDDARDPYYRKHQAITLQILALLYEHAQQFDDAAKSHARAIVIDRELVDNFPSVGSNQVDLAHAYGNQGVFLWRSKRSTEAIEAMQTSIGIWEKLIARYPREQYYHEAAAQTLSNLAAYSMDSGNEADVASALNRAVSCLEKVECKTRSAVQVHATVANNLSKLIELHAQRGSRGQAIDACRLLVKVGEKLAARPSATSDDAYRLGLAYAQTSFQFVRATKHEEALSWVEKSVHALERMSPGNEAQNRAVRAALSRALQMQAQALRQLKRSAEAIAVWDRVLLSASNASEQPLMKSLRALALADSGDHKAAATEVEELAARPALRGEVLYNLACVSSVCSAGARQDAQLTVAERENAGDAYAVRAFALLERAQAAGFFRSAANVAHTASDPDLDALRNRPDFKKLLGDLGRKE
jgi:tetratricopeptide (TPR) repeat protein